jgi:hypothetical protein
MSTQTYPTFLGSNPYDNKSFNINFDKEKNNLKERMKEKNEKALKDIGVEDRHKKIWEYNIIELGIGLKNAWFGLFDDITEGQFNLSILTKNDRLIFIGLTLIIFGFFVYFINFFDYDI